MGRKEIEEIKIKLTASEGKVLGLEITVAEGIAHIEELKREIETSPNGEALKNEIAKLKIQIGGQDQEIRGLYNNLKEAAEAFEKLESNKAISNVIVFKRGENKKPKKGYRFVSGPGGKGLIEVKADGKE